MLCLEAQSTAQKKQTKPKPIQREAQYTNPKSLSLSLSILFFFLSDIDTKLLRHLSELWGNKRDEAVCGGESGEGAEQPRRRLHFDGWDDGEAW